MLPQAFFYTYVPAGEDRVEFVVSHGALEDPVAGAYFKESFTPGPKSSLLPGLEEVTVSQSIVEDEWGSWVSVFVPLTNDEGEIVATLGIDYLSSEISDIQNSILRNVIPVFLGFYFIFFLFVLVISNWLISPIVDLTQAASRISQGDLTAGFEIQTPKFKKDETDSLAESLALMLENILKRDEQIRAVIAEQQDFIIRLDAEQHLIFVNSIFCETFGFDQASLEVFPMGLMVYPDDVPILEDFLTQTLPDISAQAPESKLEIRMLYKNGDVRYIQWSIRGIFSPDGSLMEYQTVGRDITDLKSLQKELEVTNQKLKRLSHQLLDRRENEIKLLAQNLHDQVLSNFTALVSTELADTGDQAVSSVYSEVVDILRQMIYDLRSPMLAYGLYYALEDYLEDLSGKLEQTQALVFDIALSDVRYDEIVEIQIFRMVQEACNNILTHAQADLIKISGMLTEAHLQICIEDNGIGFASSVEDTQPFGEFILNKHFGLAGMQERADLIGATLTVKSIPGQGSTIQIVFIPETIESPKNS